MDISVFISELLYEHDCVIVPGFGGFICNYRPAEIHPVLHVVNPPSKSVSFNRNLSSNDGLLVNYIAKRGNLSFQKSHELIATWVTSSKALLRNNETINLKKVGRVYSDIEGNIQFLPDESVNYLKASFALKPLTALPVLRGKEVDFTEKFTHETKKHIGSQRGTWRIAASFLLVASIGTLITMMLMGVNIKSLDLNEAGVLGFLTHFSSSKEDAMKPLPVNTERPVVAVTATIASVTKNETVAAKPADVPLLQPGYYIITGAFADGNNAEKKKLQLETQFPGIYILTYKSNGLTKVGYLVGTDPATAHSKLQAARQDNSDYWLLKK